MGKTIENTETGDQSRTVELAKCRCGCGEPVQRLFKQGHDQRLISKLAFDVVEGSGRGLNLLAAEDASKDIQWRIDQIHDKMCERLSPGLAAKFHSAAMVRWANLKKPADSTDTVTVQEAAQESTTEAVNPASSSGGFGLGAKVQVKVGRYVYDGEVAGMSQSGKVTAVDYVNKAGNKKTIAAPKEIKLV